MRKLVIIALIGVLAACLNSQSDNKPRPDPADSCGSAWMQGLVGQSATVLPGLNLPKDTRVIGPKDAITQDYVPTRMNFEIDKKGTIEKVACY